MALTLGTALVALAQVQCIKRDTLTKGHLRNHIYSCSRLWVRSVSSLTVIHGLDVMILRGTCSVLHLCHYVRVQGGLRSIKRPKFRT